MGCGKSTTPAYSSDSRFVAGGKKSLTPERTEKDRRERRVTAPFRTTKRWAYATLSDRRETQSDLTLTKKKPGLLRDRAFWFVGFSVRRCTARRTGIGAGC